MYSLSLCCVSKFEPFSSRFINLMSNWCKKTGTEFVLALDAPDEPNLISRLKYPFPIPTTVVHSKGYIESVLDSVIDKCSGDYVLRLDDDEFMSLEMQKWLEKRDFKSDLYTFQRANLWEDENHYIANTPLWPDIQTRLATKEKSYGRTEIHCLSPYGFGEALDYKILHYKYLIKDYRERKSIAERYEAVKPSAGLGSLYKQYYLPEDCFERIQTYEL